MDAKTSRGTSRRKDSFRTLEAAPGVPTFPGRWTRALEVVHEPRSTASIQAFDSRRAAVCDPQAGIERFGWRGNRGENRVERGGSARSI